MKVLVAIRYTNECTVNLCFESVKRQTYPIDEIILIDNVMPNKEAHNLTFDYAYKNGFDLLLNVAADGILEKTLLEECVKLMVEGIWIVTTYGRDVILPDPAPGPSALMNMNVIKDEYRVDEKRKTHPMWDLEFVNEVSAKTKCRRAYMKKIISIHHPIWTAEEMFGKVRVSLPRYWNQPKSVNKYKRFFKSRIKRNPHNMVLRVGWDLFRRMYHDGLWNWILYDLDKRQQREYWKKFRKQYPTLTGKEFFCLPGWENTARELVGKGIMPEFSVKRLRGRKGSRFDFDIR